MGRGAVQKQPGTGEASVVHRGLERTAAPSEKRKRKTNKAMERVGGEKVWPGVFEAARFEENIRRPRAGGVEAKHERDFERVAGDESEVNGAADGLNGFRVWGLGHLKVYYKL